MSSLPKFVVHDSSGIRFRDGPSNTPANSSHFTDIEGKVKYYATSEDGKFLAWISNGEVCVVEEPQWKRIGTLQHPKAQELCFSPLGNYIAIYDTYFQTKSSDAATSAPNLRIYNIREKKMVKSYVQKSQSDWKPSWTKDESVMARLVGNEVQFFQGGNLDNPVAKKSLEKLRGFSLSPSLENHFVIFFVPSIKGAPANLSLYKYPTFKEQSDALAFRSCFKVDKIESFWNDPCSAALILTTGEVNKKGESSTYYGELTLFYFNINGYSNRVTFPKQGNVRAVAWMPDGAEFIAVYGSAPSRASIFNSKCEAVKEFGENSRNLVIPNAIGNLILLGGLGNISPRFEFWDVAKVKPLGLPHEIPDITQMEWSPCGQYLLTSTCSPRLRVNNGYKVWHYSGTLIQEHICTPPDELYNASWLPDKTLAKPFQIKMEPIKGIKSEIKSASVLRYVPPSQRDRVTLEARKHLSEREVESASEKKAKKKAVAKQKMEEKRQKMEEKWQKVEEEKGMDKDWREKQEGEEGSDNTKGKKDNKAARLKKVKKKLESIQKLKQDMADGKYMDPGQLLKIESEQSLLEEIEKLSVS